MIHDVPQPPALPVPASGRDRVAQRTLEALSAAEWDLLAATFIDGHRRASRGLMVAIATLIAALMGAGLWTKSPVPLLAAMVPILGLGPAAILMDRLLRRRLVDVGRELGLDKRAAATAASIVSRQVLGRLASQELPPAVQDRGR